MAISWIEMILRLVGASVLGGLVGVQRERAEKPAGLRTHILVCLGSALITQVSIYPFEGQTHADPTRIAAGIIIGIGFLGAGTIIRQGSVVRGLTTAASVWVTAGVGMAIGLGFYIPAVTTAVLIVIILTILKEIEIRIQKGDKFISVVSVDQPGQLGKVGLVLGELGINIRQIELEREEGSRICIIRLAVESLDNSRSETVVEQLSGIEGISSAIWEE